ncbi:hypothetical protein QZM38_13720 [Burkholderia orbicola]|uniref:hypothetical protein n=1 Tax=Burkholderia orbicola TaxID=2978683 RepID=UPI0026560BE4|nr:hypothetical protein [Burkholderia orbicola]MDN7481883.1 hypothetical protein [Burkholderia orbicola]
MTTENSRADALTPCVHADDPKACYRVRCQLGGKCVDDDMSPRQPAAAPMPPNAQLRRVMDLLDAHLGDSDPTLEGMTQEEIEEEFPVVAAMQIIVGLYQDPPTASDTAPSPADEQRIEAMARAMNVATDGHDRYWTGYVRSATAALRALRKLHPAPSPADERAAFEAWREKHAFNMQRGGLTEGYAWGAWEARATASQPAAAAGQEAVTIYQARQLSDEKDRWDDVHEPVYSVCVTQPQFYETRVVYTAPPAQVATRQLTDEQRKSIWWAVLTAEADEPTPGSLMHRRAQDLRALLATRQPEPFTLTSALEWAGVPDVCRKDPEPRTEVADDDEVCADRYRYLRARMSFVQAPGKGPSMSLRAAIPAPNHDFNRDFIGDRFDASVDATIDAARAGEGQ